MKAIFDVLPAGTAVSVSRGLYKHVGLLTEPTYGSERHVISLNPGLHGRQVVEEPVSVFARGKPVSVIQMKSTLPEHSVLARARSGHHPTYDWLSFNCEHFIRFAHGLQSKSPQISFWTVTAIGVWFLARG